MDRNSECMIPLYIFLAKFFLISTRTFHSRANFEIRTVLLRFQFLKAEAAAQTKNDACILVFQSSENMCCMSGVIKIVWEFDAYLMRSAKNIQFNVQVKLQEYLMRTTLHSWNILYREIS